MLPHAGGLAHPLVQSSRPAVHGGATVAVGAWGDGRSTAASWYVTDIEGIGYRGTLHGCVEREGGREGEREKERERDGEANKE